MDHPQRKPNRLREYDYSTPGVYFVTICTKDRKNLLWDNAERGVANPQEVVLSSYGKVVKCAVEKITQHYPMVLVEHYVIMPNHIHLLLHIISNDDGRPMVAPTISTVVQQMKGHVTKQIGNAIWQKLFHDHVVRCERDYQKIWNYIDGNPMKWAEDCFYTE